MLFWFLGHLHRPLLSAVQHPQYPHSIADYAIGSDVRRAGDDQLPRSLNPAWASHLREARQALHARLDSIVNGGGGPGLSASM